MSQQENKYWLGENQKVFRGYPIVCYCKHCANEAIEIREYESGSYNYDTNYYCTCEASQKVDTLRKEVYTLERELASIKKSFDDAIMVEADQYVLERQERELSEVCKRNGISISKEQLRKIFNLEGGESGDK